MGEPTAAGIAGLMIASIRSCLSPRPPKAAAQGVIPAQPFSEAALADARASGKPVFV